MADRRQHQAASPQEHRCQDGGRDGRATSWALAGAPWPHRAARVHRRSSSCAPRLGFGRCASGHDVGSRLCGMCAQVPAAERPRARSDARRLPRPDAQRPVSSRRSRSCGAAARRPRPVSPAPSPLKLLGPSPPPRPRLAEQHAAHLAAAAPVRQRCINTHGTSRTVSRAAEAGAPRGRTGALVRRARSKIRPDSASGIGPLGTVRRQPRPPAAGAPHTTPRIPRHAEDRAQQGPLAPARGIGPLGTVAPGWHLIACFPERSHRAAAGVCRPVMNRTARRRGIARCLATTPAQTSLGPC